MSYHNRRLDHTPYPQRHPYLPVLVEICSAAMNSAAHRRSTVSSRLRENRSQTPSSSNGRRRKSHSPTARASEDVEMHTEPNATRRKRKQTVAPSTSGMSHILNARPTRASENVAAAPIDRGRKLRHRPQSRLSEDVEVHVTQDTQSGWRYGKNKKKDRSQSREAPQRLSRKVTTPEPLEEEQGSEKHYSGAFAAADFARMREELDTIKKVRFVNVFAMLYIDRDMLSTSPSQRKRSTDRVR